MPSGKLITRFGIPSVDLSELCQEKLGKSDALLKPKTKMVNKLIIVFSMFEYFKIVSIVTFVTLFYCFIVIFICVESLNLQVVGWFS
jgi:hypothetical protein